jgi:hypothetical protein
VTLIRPFHLICRSHRPKQINTIWLEKCQTGINKGVNDSRSHHDTPTNMGARMHASAHPPLLPLSPEATGVQRGSSASHHAIQTEVTGMACLLDFSLKAFSLPLFDHLPPLVAKAVQTLCQSDIGAVWHTRYMATDTSPTLAMVGHTAPTDLLEQTGAALLADIVRKGQRAAWELSDSELTAISPVCRLARAFACPCSDRSGHVVALLLAGFTQAVCDVRHRATARPFAPRCRCWASKSTVCA